MDRISILVSHREKSLPILLRMSLFLPGISPNRPFSTGRVEVYHCTYFEVCPRNVRKRDV
ncbi:UNVERIFIED_ORG: hypothetical protein QOE_4580 [Clostridioides difficile F501]